MNAHIKIERTPNGYAYNGLEASGLSPRQCQDLLLLADGKSHAERANFFNCGPSNIRNIVANLFLKLDADNAPELITKAFKSGVLRILALALALHVSTTAQFMPTQEDVIARYQRVRVRPRGSSMRLRRGTLMWIPETGELVIV